MKRLFSYVFLFLLLSWSCLLLLSVISVYIAFPSLWWFGLLGLSFPVLIFGECLLLFLAFFINWKMVLIPILALALSWNNLQHYFAFNNDSNSKANGNTLKVMTYNVNVFDLYNWTQNKTTKDSMLALIKRVDPDVLCLQEFYTESTPPFNPYSSLKKHFPYENFYRGIELQESYYWGLATFSKYPLYNSRTIGLTDNKLNLCQVNEIQLNDTRISIYNTHLHSYHIKNQDLEGFNKSLEMEQNLGAFLGILRKLKGVYARRLKQVKAIHEDVLKNKNKVLICGDFNDTPNSYPYHLMKKGLKDAFLETGSGIGGTYRGGTLTRSLPSIRIDYILCDTSFQVNSFAILKYPYSDHYPVVSEISLKN